MRINLSDLEIVMDKESREGGQRSRCDDREMKKRSRCDDRERRRKKRSRLSRFEDVATEVKGSRDLDATSGVQFHASWYGSIAKPSANLSLDALSKAKKALQMHLECCLQVNINKKKKDAFQILKPQLEVNPEENPHFDPRMGLDQNKLLRPKAKRMSFQFVEQGKWTRDAENIKCKSQFGEAKARELEVKQAHLAKAKDDINPNLIQVSERLMRKEKPKDPIPDVEWWDVNVLADGAVSESNLKIEKLTHYIEHPRPFEPPAEAPPPPPQPLKLTKEEQKKRTQRRLAKEKEKQEMIRQGLLEPPKSKVKMSNLMKVLGAQATQDPTKLEKEIRAAAAERQQAHADRNAARKLTPAEKREKKERKLFDDPTTVETIVSVFKINKLSHPKTRFKVEMNARQNRLTGCSVMTDELSVVVVEGQSKAIKRYQKLMLKRINWDDEAVKKEGEEEEDEEENKCWLVWQGRVGRPSFHRFVVQERMTESAANKVFTDAGVGHYWDLAVNYTQD